MSHAPSSLGGQELVALAGLLLVHALYRRAYAALPLHRDTGFYVPNHAVRTGHLGLFRGWNSQFSGGSRALPQLVHTWLYLRVGSRRYGRAFRALYAILAVAAALGIAQIAVVLWGMPAALCAALLGLALMAETQYGTYFESAEAFEVVAQTLGVGMVVTAVAGDAPALAIAGLVLLWFDAVAIKLTGGAVASCVSAAVLWVAPSWWAGVVAIGALAVGAWWRLVRATGVELPVLFSRLRRHEAYVRRNYSGLWLIVVKSAFSLRLLLRNPGIPVGGAIGAWLAARGAWSGAEVAPATLVVIAYAAGVAVGFLRQGHRVWYYLVPALPLVALLATHAILELVPVEMAPWSIAAGLAVVSAVVNLWPRLRHDREAASVRIFAVYDRPGKRAGTEMAAANARVERFARAIRDQVAGHTLLVVGPCNQASVLCDAAYDTPLTSLCELTRAVAGDSGPWLRDALDRDPPAFVLDTNRADWDVEGPLLQEHGPYQEVHVDEGLRLLRRVEGEPR